eukprot:502071-Prorocentrum_minimum.AAC.1
MLPEGPHHSLFRRSACTIHLDLRSVVGAEALGRLHSTPPPLRSRRLTRDGAWRSETGGTSGGGQGEKGRSGGGRFRDPGPSKGEQSCARKPIRARDEAYAYSVANQGERRGICLQCGPRMGREGVHRDTTWWSHRVRIVATAERVGAEQEPCSRVNPTELSYVRLAAGLSYVRLAA